MDEVSASRLHVLDAAVVRAAESAAMGAFGGRSELRVAALASLLCLLPACTSSTKIISEPSGAKLYLDGEYVGTTPYTMSDQKIVGSKTNIKLELPGYATRMEVISRSEEFDVGACIGGIFLLVPFLWIEGYKPEHIYELTPEVEQAP